MTVMPPWMSRSQLRVTTCRDDSVPLLHPESLARFTARLMSFIDANPVARLVIDMRWNNGGNTASGQPLLLSLIGNAKVNQRGRLFVIIGRRTLSAAQNMSTYFERYTNAIFVGEPTGSSLRRSPTFAPGATPRSRRSSRHRCDKCGKRR